MTRRLKVLELIKGLDIGGAEVLLAERLRLADHGAFDYEVAYLDPSRDQLVPRLAETGVKVWSLNARNRMDLTWAWRLRSHLVTNGPQVVHVHSPLMAVVVRLIIISLGKRRPALVSTEHSINYHPITRLLDRLTIRADDAVIAVSQAAASSVVTRHARHVQVIHHGINVAYLRQLKASRDVLDRDLGAVASPRIVTVANYRPEKGHETLLEAAPAIHKAIPGASLITIGHGPEHLRIEEAVRSRGMSHYFHVRGPDPDAVKWTAIADVFVLPSDREGRPVALMEAQACGIAVVATSVGGVPDLIEDGTSGILVPPRDAEALASAVVAVLTQAQVRERLEDGARVSSETYDLAHACTEIQDLYVRVAESKYR